MKILALIALVLAVAVLGFALWVRLAPADTARWHVAPNAPGWDQSGPWNSVQVLTGGAALRLSTDRGDPATLLVQLDALAMATPRTTRLAGTAESGRITWQTRSALWGFPDFTTAEVRDDGLYIHARLRFGREDMGVNAARLTDWLSRL